MRYVIDNIAPAFCKTVGEAPHWEPQTRSLVFVDIREGDIHKYYDETRFIESVHVDGEVGFAVPHKQDRYVIGQGSSISSLQWGKCLTTKLATVDAYRFNDGKCDPKGRLWTGTLGAEDEQRVLYSLEGDGSLVKRLTNLQFANGMAWSSDASTMYLVDTMPRLIYALDFNIETGHIDNKRVLVNFNSLGNESEIGRPDGMCTDVDGNLWVACFGGGKVIHIDRNTSQKLGGIEFDGAKQITSCCFGGDDLSDLYVTSARSRLSIAEQQEQPLAGSVFKVTGVGVKGAPVSAYSGNE